MTSAQEAAGAPDPSDLGYEQAREELVEVVRRLESSGPGLEESLRLWERGEALARRCEEWLAGARARIEAVQAAQEAAQEQRDGGPATGPAHDIAGDGTTG